jgi:dipeptidyl aminopeptidase/acylaminoacyl peptidase
MMTRYGPVIGVSLFLLLAFCACTPREDALIPRARLFDNPDKSMLRISPDGRYISYLAPVDKVMNVWVAKVDKPEDAHPVSKSAVRSISMYMWTHTGRHLLYLQDDGGDENYAMHRVDVETGGDVNLTPFDEIIGADGKPIMLPSGKKMRPTVLPVANSADHPDEVVIRINNRDPQYFDLYRLNVLTGEMTLLLRNDGFKSFVVDDTYAVRLAAKSTESGGTTYFAPDGRGGWKPSIEVGAEDDVNTWIPGYTSDGATLYMIDSRGRNTSALVAIDAATGATRELATSGKADISDVVTHPRTGIAQAAATKHERISWQVIDKDLASDFEYLARVVDGDFEITSRTLDDKLWTVAFVIDDGPQRLYLYDRARKEAKFLFSVRRHLENAKLSKMTPVRIASRDGLELVSYLTLPRWTDPDRNGRPDAPLPMVLLVHGGPWSRDSWGFHPWHQWLANRGYAVLSVNYRGSTGFGKEFTNAANHEWAGKMHDDLIDAVDWAIAEGITAKDRVAIMGGSYGGYATLVGLTFTPDRFVCGIDIVGPSNLRTLLETIPPYWKPQLEHWALRVGDPRTEEGRALLEARSPLNYVEKIKKPLLIGQGANDPRVKQSESDQIVKQMQKKNIPVTYVLYPDEGHGFLRAENRLSFIAVTEQFLSKHLGGRAEPIGKDFLNSSLEVREGAKLIPGISEAMPKEPRK